MQLHFLLVTHLIRVMQCWNCQTGFLFPRDTLLHQCRTTIIRCGALTVASVESRQGCALFEFKDLRIITAVHCTPVLHTTLHIIWPPRTETTVGQFGQWLEIGIFQALRYWKILFSPSDFEPTSVRNCQFLTRPVRNCQHADPYQVLGLERSEQQ